MEKLIEIWEKVLFYLSEIWERVLFYLSEIWEIASLYMSQAWKAISPFLLDVWEKFLSVFCQYGAVCSDGNLSLMGGAVIALVVVSIIVLIFAVITLVRNS